MPALSSAQLLFIARQHFDAGRLAEAEGLCRKIVAGDPACAAALHLCGLIAERLGRKEVAAAFLQRAVTAAPGNAVHLADLGRALRAVGRIEDAVAAARQSLQLEPDSFDALCGLADALHAAGENQEAIDLYRRALRARPDAAHIRARLGDVLLAAQKIDDAIASFTQALTILADDPLLHLKLGDALQRNGRLDEAIASYHAALALRPNSAEGYRRLGSAQRRAKQLSQAVASLERAVELDPNDAGGHVQLGNVLLELGIPERAAEAYYRAITLKAGDSDAYAKIGEGVADESRIDAAIDLCSKLLAQQANSAAVCIDAARAFQRRRYLDAAITAYRRALELEPDQIVALNNLSLALKDAGRLDEAIDCSRRAVRAHPHSSTCHGNLLYALHFHSDVDGPAFLAEHRRWAQRHAQPLTSHNAPHDRHASGATTAANADRRRLRIGYVSPNFNVHPVGRFLYALFAHHDHAQFEIVCYSSTRRADELTGHFRAHADRWVEAAHLSDAALAERIVADGIDILVDLTMHMADSRLLMFARKPAPIQITYLAYCSTTGLDTIDYRLSDPYLDPPGAQPLRYVEQSVRLPETYWCYDPIIETPEVNELPALSCGYVTFASLNNFCKASPAALALWAKLLSAVPASRLVLHAHRGSHRDRTRALFAAAGVDPNRLQFSELLPLRDYFKLYNAIDLALDPFPYPGGTTTCDALWMGVPTVSLAGKLPFTRSGLSILSNAGLSDLAVESEEHYLETAIALAGDLPRLARWRATLRQRLKNSPLMDGPRFARNMETAYLAMWQANQGRRDPFIGPTSIF